MNKSKIVRSAAACLLAAAIMAPAAYAAEPAQPKAEQQPDRLPAAKGHFHEEHKKHHREHALGHEQYRLAKLRYMAEYFGIAVEGKTSEQLKGELKAAKEKDPAKWEAFKAENRAKRLEMLRQAAKEYGLETEGRTAEQLREDIRKFQRSKDAADDSRR
ncbi:hypothetical protein [Paenibacillus sp. FSL H8-0537]|uniref:hypothetical protein n=1 Tax=Paenibacillus sp. FSL H8-0537 TaxID=2921399 RepID=UPI0031019878